MTGESPYEKKKQPKKIEVLLDSLLHKLSGSTSQDIKEQILDNVDILALGSRASDCVARACNRAIYEAEAVGNSKPGWKKLFQSK